MDNLLSIPSSDALYHHGIKGMHWGIRRFQPYPKGSKKKGKEVGEAAKKAPEKKLSEKEAKELYEKEKERALKSGSAGDIIQFKGDLTNTQMETAIKRLDLEKKLTNYATPVVKSSKERFNEIMNDVKTFNNWTNIGIDAYNTFARIYNASERGAKKKMKLVAGGPGGGGKKKK